MSDKPSRRYCIFRRAPGRHAGAMFPPRALHIAIVLALFLTATVAAKTKFSSVMSSPEAAKVSFSGKKIAALVIDKDDSLRVAGEEGLVNELNARGIRGV